MKNLKPWKKSLALVLLVCTIALMIGCIGTAVFAESDNTTVAESTAETTIAQQEGDTAGKTDSASDTKADDLEAEAASYVASTSFWDTIAIPFSYVIKGCNWLTRGIYPLTLLLFAIVMKIVLFPFGIKQQKNSVKQAKLRPKEMAIRSKYAGRTDKVTQQKMQEEIMGLYQSENFNPMGGCLPLLLQFPILISLFRVVYNPLRNLLDVTTEAVTQIGQVIIRNGFATKTQLMYDINIMNAINNNVKDDGVFNKLFGGITDKLTSLSDFPKISLFGLDLTQTPKEAVGHERLLWIIPVVTFIAVFASMKLTKKFTYQPTTNANGDASTSMKVMDFVMPLMSTFFAVIYPSVLGLYWIYQNLLGVVQQIILAKMYPIPQFTDEEYEQARREMLGRSSKKKKSVNAVRNPRSRHHIDDDDDDITAASDSGRESYEGQQGSLMMKAKMKEDVPAPESEKEKE